MGGDQQNLGISDEIGHVQGGMATDRTWVFPVRTQYLFSRDWLLLHFTTVSSL